MNQFRNIGTVRLSAGFFVCFWFTQTIKKKFFWYTISTAWIYQQANFFTQKIFKRHLDSLPSLPKLRLWVFS